MSLCVEAYETLQGASDQGYEDQDEDAQEWGEWQDPAPMLERIPGLLFVLQIVLEPKAVALQLEPSLHQEEAPTGLVNLHSIQ